MDKKWLIMNVASSQSLRFILSFETVLKFYSRDAWIKVTKHNFMAYLTSGPGPKGDVNTRGSRMKFFNLPRNLVNVNALKNNV